MLFGMCKLRWSEQDTCYECFYLAMQYMLEALEVIIGIHPSMLSFNKLTQLVWTFQ